MFNPITILFQFDYFDDGTKDEEEIYSEIESYVMEFEEVTPNVIVDSFEMDIEEDDEEGTFKYTIYIYGQQLELQ